MQAEVRELRRRTSRRSRTRCGLPTSLTSARGPAWSTWRPCSTRSRAASSAGAPRRVEHAHGPGPRRARDGDLDSCPRGRRRPHRTSGTPRRGVAIHADPLTERLDEAGAAPSVGSVGDAYDNPSPRSRPLERVDWHNQRRLHSACRDLTHAVYEQVHYLQHPAFTEALVHSHESPATPGRFTGGTMSRWSSVSLDRFAYTTVRATSRSGAEYPARCSSLYCFAPVKPSAQGS